jgi:hypothetical protein
MVIFNVPIGGLFCHHFLANFFSVFIDVSSIVDDGRLALDLIDRARPNQDFLSLKLIIFIGKSFVSTCIS